MLCMRLLLLLALFERLAAAGTFTFTTTNLVVSASNNLNFSITRNAVPSTATYMELLFPDDANVLTASSSSLNSSSLVSGTTVNYTSSGLKVQLAGTLQTSVSLNLYVATITNPTYVTGLSNIAVKFWNVATLVETISFGAQPIQTISGSLPNCNWQFSPSTNSNGTLSITTTTSHDLPTGTSNSVILSFASAWSGILNATTKYGLVGTNVPGKSTFTVNGSPAPITDWTISASATAIAIAINNNVPISAGSTLVITITNILTPPLQTVQASKQSLKLTTNNGKGTVDESSTCNVAAISPYTLTGCSIISTGAQVSSNFTIAGSLGNVMGSEIDINDTVAIAYPANVQLPLSNFLVFNTSNQTVWSNTSLPVNSTYQEVNISFIRTNSLTTTETYSQSNTIFAYKFNDSLVLPNSVEPITFTLTFIRGSARYMLCQPQLTGISPGTISAFTLSSNPTTVAATAAYTLNLTLQDYISAGGGIKITFPADVVIPAAVVCTTSPDSGPTCTKDSSSNSILVNCSILVPKGTLSLTFNGLQNPTTPLSSLNISVVSYNDATRSSATTIDTGNESPSISYTAATISAPTLSNTSCLGETLESCVYTLTYSNTVLLKAGTIVQLALPSAYSTDVTYSSTFSCASQSPVSISPTASPLRYTLTSDCPATSSLALTFKLVNPSKTGSYVGLAIVHYTSTNSPIEQTTSPIPMSVPQPSKFGLFTVTNDAQVKTSLSGSLTFNFQSKTNLPAGTFLKVYYPSDFSGWAAISSCVGSCLYNSSPSNSIVITLTAAVTSGTTTSFKFSGLQFPRSALPCTFTLVASADAAGTVAYHSSSSQFSMAYFQSMTVAYLSGTPNYLGSTDNIRLSLSLAVPLLLGDKLTVTLPNLYSLSSAATTFSDGWFSYTVTANPNVVLAVVNSAAAGLTLANMSISGYTSATNRMLTGSIVVDHSDSGSYQIHTSSSVPWALSCNYPCRTCLSTNVSGCLTCYDKIIEPSNYTFNGTTGTCVSLCSSTLQYYSSSSQCQPCTQPCLQCLNSSFCKSCSDPLQFLLADGTCNTSCNSVGYFQQIYSVVLNNGSSSTQVSCLACDPICYQCVNSSLTCLRCANSAQVLYPDHTCSTSACPTGYYNNSGICSVCLTNCLTCQFASNCTTCKPGYAYDSMGLCVSQCTSQYWDVTSNKCVCGQDCTTCQASSMNLCTGCVSSYYLKNSTCVANCGTSTFNSSGVCYSCSAGCSTCTSAQQCSTCQPTHYLFNNTCYSACSLLGDGYVNYDVSPKICVKCASGCSICLPAQPSNCTACLANYTLNALTNLCDCSNCNSTTTLTCPTGFVLQSGSCVIAQSAVSGQATLIIYAILAVSWLAFCFISKLLTKGVFVQYGIAAGLAPLELSSYIVLLGVAASSSSRRLLAGTSLDSGTICVIIALALNYVLNALHVWVYLKYLAPDEQFPKNKKSQKNRGLNMALLVFATLTNFRLYQLVFSSLCNAKLLKTRLLNISKFMPLNLLNCSNIVVSFIAVAGFGLVCANSVASQTQYYLSIIAIIIIALAVIFTLSSFLKDEDFFEVVCKYEGTDGISNTEEALQKGEEHQFDSNIAPKGKNYKIMNEPTVMLMNEEDQGDQPIRKGQYGKDPLKPIVIESSLAAFADLDLSDKDLSVKKESAEEAYSDEQSKAESGSASKMRRKVSRRLEERPSNNLLRIQESRVQEQAEEQKVDSIINELDSSVSLNGQQNLIRANSTSPREQLPNRRKQNSPTNEQQRSMNLTSASAGKGAHSRDGSESKLISSSKLIQIKSKESGARHGSVQLMEPANSSQSDTVSDIQAKEQPIDLQFIEKFYHEGELEFSEPDIEYNEVSPSQFNFENQRFDDSVLMNMEASESGDNDQRAARSTPLKKFNLNELKKNFD